MATRTPEKNLVEETRKQFEARLNELQPAVDEANELRALVALMKGEAPTTDGNSPPQRRRRRGSRQGDFLKLVVDKPGISVSQAAKEMEIGPNYLYRVAKSLEEDGKVRKDGQGYVPVEAGSASTDGDQA